MIEASPWPWKKDIDSTIVDSCISLNIFRSGMDLSSKLSCLVRGVVQGKFKKKAAGRQQVILSGNCCDNFSQLLLNLGFRPTFAGFFWANCFVIDVSCNQIYHNCCKLQMKGPLFKQLYNLCIANDNLLPPLFRYDMWGC